MPNIFDSLEASVFRTTTRVMGYDASWLPSGSAGTPLLARVHLKDPNKKGDEYEMAKVDFRIKEPFMEYMEPDFPGLYEIVEANGGTTGEVVIIEGISFEVSSVTRIFDGKTYKAILIPV